MLRPIYGWIQRESRAQHIRSLLHASAGSVSFLLVEVRCFGAALGRTRLATPHLKRVADALGMTKLAPGDPFFSCSCIVFNECFGMAGDETLVK